MVLALAKLWQRVAHGARAIVAEVVAEKLVEVVRHRHFAIYGKLQVVAQRAARRIDAVLVGDLRKEVRRGVHRSTVLE